MVSQSQTTPALASEIITQTTTRGPGKIKQVFDQMINAVLFLVKTDPICQRINFIWV